GSGRRRERTERTEEAPAEIDHGASLADEAEDFEEPEYLGEEGSLDEEGPEGVHAEDSDDEDSPRVGFRNIPTWQETVGYVIATNMESRAKNPGSGRS